LLYLDIRAIGFVPMVSFPFPYKYLIGVGFYFYLKRLVPQVKTNSSKLEYLLFLPALGYGAIRTYWYITLHTGKDPGIFRRVYDTGFFVYNEFIYLTFNLVLLFFGIRFLKKYRPMLKGFRTTLRNWDWIIRFTYILMVLTMLNLVHQFFSVPANLQYSGNYYLIILILNSVYIYWVGFETFRNSKFLFTAFALKEPEVDATDTDLNWHQKLEHHMTHEEVFTNIGLKVSDLAILVGTTEKALSSHIHERFNSSFPDYVNQKRVEKVKMLLMDSEKEKYTLQAIAEKAGFASKSSFNDVFKKFTRLTPTQYIKTQKK